MTDKVHQHLAEKRRRASAAERAEKRAVRSSAEQLQVLDARGATASRERAKLGRG